MNKLFIIIFVVLSLGLDSCKFTTNNKKVSSCDTALYINHLSHNIEQYNNTNLEIGLKEIHLDSSLYYVNKLILCDSMKREFHNIRLNILITENNFLDLNEAIEEYFKLFNSKDNQLLHFYKGICLKKLGMTTESEFQFNQADSLLFSKLNLTPNNSMLLIQSIYFDFYKNGFNSAKNQYNMLLNKHPDDSILILFKYRIDSIYIDTSDVFFGP